MLVIPDWVDSEQWLYENMPSKDSKYYGRATRQRGRIIRVGLSGLGAVAVNSEVTSVLNQQSDYNKAVAVNSQLAQRINVLDQNIAQWKSAKVLEKDRTAALAVLNKQRSQAVADQSKLKSALASLMVAAGQDIKGQSSVDPAADAKYKSDLTTRLNNLTKARADAIAEVEPGVELNKALSTIDGQINQIKSQIRAAGGKVSGLSGLGINYWYEDYPTDYPVYVNGLGDLGKWPKIKIKTPHFVSEAARQVKGGIKQLATNVRNITKKLPAANFMSKVAARFPLTAPIVRLTGNKQQKRLAVQGMKALAAVAIIVAAVALAPLVLPSLVAATSAAGAAVVSAGSAIAAGAAAAGGAIAAGAATAGAFVGAHALATGAVIAGGAALAMGKKKKKKAPGQTAPLPGQIQDADNDEYVWEDAPPASSDPVGGDPASSDPGSTQDQAPVQSAPYIAPGVEVQPAPTQPAPYIAPSSPAYNSYSGGGGGSGGGPGPIDNGYETNPQAYGDGSAVAVSETKPEAPKSNTVKYLVGVGALAAVGGLTYYFMTRK